MVCERLAELGKKVRACASGIHPELIDKLLAEYKTPEQIIGENGLLKQLTKAVLERALKAKWTEHFGYEKHDPWARAAGTRGRKFG